MGKRILATVAALLALGGTGWKVLANSADDAGRNGGRIVKHLPDRPPSLPEVPIPHTAPESIEAPQAVRNWIDDLSPENAKEVLGDACTLKDLSEVIITDADIKQWVYDHKYAYGEDQLTALVGLVKEMRGHASLDTVCAMAG